MLTILIPCAGEGRRFKEAGYSEPKPLIPVRGVPMLRRVIDNVRPADDHFFVFASREEYGIRGHIRNKKWLPIGSYWINNLKEKTDGAARTCLLASSSIDPDHPLLIANCDQLVEGGIGPLLETDADAAVLTVEKRGDPRWSYVSHSFGSVRSVYEKPTGFNLTWLNRATTGHYYFRRAGDFFAAAECMIALDDRTNGEFYVAPTLNYLIAARKKVVEVRVEDYGGKFVGLGTPEDLKAYEEGK